MDPHSVVLFCKGKENKYCASSPNRCFVAHMICNAMTEIEQEPPNHIDSVVFFLVTLIAFSSYFYFKYSYQFSSGILLLK